MEQINQLQVRQGKFDSTRMTDLNHWSKNMAIKPTVFEAANRVLFSSKTNSGLNLSNGNMIEGLFGLGKTKEIDTLNWSWKMNVKGFRPITILENRTAGDTPGKYRQPIKVLVDVDLAAIGESWGPGSSDKSQIVTVTGKVKEGRGFVYTLQTYTESQDHFIKKSYLEPGQKWTRMYTIRGEAAESGGHTERNTSIEYKNSLVKLRKQCKVTDYAAQAVLEIACTDNDGKVTKYWEEAQLVDYRRELNKEISKLAMYSRLGDAPLIDPDSGYPINPGAGLEQQIEFGGNVQRYTTLSVDLIEAFFDKIVYSRISPGELGDITGVSGHYGMKEFAKVLDVWTGNKSIVRNSEDFIAKTSGYNKNSLSTGYSFVSYNLPTGGNFKLIHNPMNDDKELHRDIDPLTGVPLQSQRITITDVTGGNGDSINQKDNICLVKKKKVYGTTIIEGRVGPGGEISKSPTHSGDYYRVDMSDSIGIEVKDATVTGELIKTVN
jgi:hypothetical protein